MAEPLNTPDAPPAKRPRTPGSGRKKGTPNKVTADLRALIHELVSYGMENAKDWLEDVAKGDKKHGRNPNPGRALDALAKLAEYGLPKLARHEVMGDGGGPVKVEVRKVFLQDSPYDKEPAAAGQPLDEE